MPMMQLCSAYKTKLLQCISDGILDRDFFERLKRNLGLFLALWRLEALLKTK